MNQLFALFSSVVLQSAEGTQTIKAKTTGTKKKTTSQQHFAQSGKYKKIKIKKNKKNKIKKEAAVIVEMKPNPCSVAECGLGSNLLYRNICLAFSDSAAAVSVAATNQFGWPD